MQEQPFLQYVHARATVAFKVTSDLIMHVIRLFVVFGTLTTEVSLVTLVVFLVFWETFYFTCPGPILAKTSILPE
ncbi:hypothetical protein K488DRAFT_84983 [Vararia minispora EC-137]|uniref:Uncharacterized protein n=1 Tax=Vararia minispora EC-137 TaxID=1314806 RepID=A0ACB8QNY3_9AGAM|nr:hypothetical protein K488DRAFT_84983 [Vararia minispora EC-137]